MYTLVARLDEISYTLVEPYEDIKISSVVLKESVGKSGTLTFNIDITHEAYSAMQVYKTYVYVYRNSVEIWRGRIIDISEDFYKTRSVTCEGALGFLNDSILPVYGYTGTVRGYFDKLLEYHNSQVEDTKKIHVGVITVQDNNDYIYRENSNYPSTLEELNNKLVKSLGGYIRVRFDGRLYLDYVQVYDSDNTQAITIDKNLLDYTSSLSNNNFCTVLIPLGTKTDGVALTVESVNNGSIYIENSTLVAKYGRIVKSKSWDDVTLPQNLYRKGLEYINKQALPSSFKLSAVDLSYIDTEQAPLKIGCNTTVISEFHNLSAKYFITAKETHIDAPELDSFEFGMVVNTYTAQMGNISTALEQNLRSGINDARNDLNSKIQSTANNLSGQIAETAKTITGVSGGYVVMDTYDTNGNLVQPWRILIMDSASKALARNVIQINQNGIGFSTNGVNGDYTNAWTIDGRLNADFIKAGTITADMVRGGTLEIGGNGLGASGSIVVYDQNNTPLATINRNGVDVQNGKIKGGQIEGSFLNATNIDSARISGSEIIGNIISGGTISGTNLEGGNLELGGSQDGTLTLKDRSGNELAKMDSHGLDVKKGKIQGTEIYGGTTIPFEAAQGTVKLGDFEVKETSRHIFQSSDECTGMSGADGGHGSWYLWAGYQQGNGSENTIFIVNDGQVRVEGELVVNGEEIEDMIQRLIREHSN